VDCGPDSYESKLEFWEGAHRNTIAYLFLAGIVKWVSGPGDMKPEEEELPPNWGEVPTLEELEEEQEEYWDAQLLDCYRQREHYME